MLNYSDLIAEPSRLSSFVDYVFSFYGTTEQAIYPMGATKEHISQATAVYLHMDDTDFVGDSCDREHVRDLLCSMFGYSFPSQ